ncbi:MAG: PH domain-containing protein [Algicola sp.]|nr:PH domain-containing protein [Algicola sp.]
MEEGKKQHKNVFESSTEAVVYPSKVGLELLIPVILILGIGIVSSFGESSLIGVIIQFVIMLVLVILFFSISYKVTDEVLTVIILFVIKRDIRIKNITRIVETNNPISAPAVSLSRLEVYYGKYSSTVISPRDKMRFIEHLTRLSPTIQVELKKKK